MLIPFAATKKVIMHKNTTTALDKFKLLDFKVIIFLTSTIIRLDIAFIKVSILLTVKEIAKKYYYN